MVNRPGIPEDSISQEQSKPVTGPGVGRETSMRLALDALEQALYERAPGAQQGLIHHSDRGSQYLSIRYT